MRVLHFIQPSPNRGGDPLAHVSGLAKAQAKAGLEVGILCVDNGANSVVAPALEKLEKSCSLGIKHLTLDLRAPLQALKAVGPRLHIAHKFLEQSAPDLLHFHAEEDAINALSLRLVMHRKKNALFVYSPDESQLSANSGKWLLSHPARQLDQLASGIVFNSAASEKSYHEQFGAQSYRAAIIYDGLDEEDFAPRQIIDMASDFLYVGELKANRGINTLIAAVGRLKKDHVAETLIVGAGPREKELRAQVERYGLSHQIFFNAPLCTKTAFLKGGCLLFPSKTDSIPIILLQAAAAGVPMILADTGGIRELVGDINMPLIAPNDTESLLREMSAYRENPHVFLGRAAALKQRVEKQFTAQRMATEMTAFYNSL